MADKFFPHCLIAFALFKSIAGTVTVFVKSKGASGKAVFDVICDYCFLVFDGYVVPIQLVIYGYAAVAGYVEAVFHWESPHKQCHTYCFYNYR